MRKVVELGLHEKISILAGVGPLKSTPMARFLQNEVPGIEVPAHLLERMDNAVKGIDKEDKEARRDAWRAEGIKLCIEQIQEKCYRSYSSTLRNTRQ